MNIDVLKYHNEFGYDKVEVFNVISSKRQSNQPVTMNSKSSDTTVVYKALAKKQHI